MTKQILFQWYDYLIFVSTLLVSTSIGIYYGFFEKKRKSANEYLLGGKKMKVLPVALSLAISHISAVTLVTVPAEVYRYGGSILFTNCSQLVASLFTIFVVLPVFYNLQLTNVYEYLEKRFDSKTRKLCFFINVVADMLRLPVFVYGPSLAFATVSGLNVQLISCLTTVICAFYTAVGGFKTVIWTDFFQLGVILAYFAVVCIGGVHLSGGLSTVMNTARDGGRLDIFDFSLDPKERNTIWCFIIGASVQYMSTISIHQTGVQKYLSLPTRRDSSWTLILSGFAGFMVFTCATFTGFVVYSTYQNCDPLSSKMIAKHDQLMPYYIANIADKFPGLSGLYISGLFCASLSSISSYLNSLSGIIYKDVVCVFLKRGGEANTNNVFKIIVLVTGAISTFLVLLVHYLGDLMALTSFLIGITNGPLLGVFILGLLLPRANAKGAFYGVIGAMICDGCFMVLCKYYQLKGLVKYPTKPLSIKDCQVSNLTVLLNDTISTIKNPDNYQVNPVFKISFYYYTLIGATLTVIFGLSISYFSARVDVDENLVSPVSHCLLAQKERKKRGILYRSVDGALNKLDNAQ